MNNNRLFSCNICNKKYSSYKSLWNHNKKFHSIPNVIKSSPKVDICTPEGIPTIVTTNNNANTANIIKYICKKCTKEYSSRQNRWKHEQKCIGNKNNITELEIIKEENKKLDNENKNKELELLIKKEEKEILQLKLKLEKSEMIDNVTLRQLNKKLLERHN